MKLEEGNDSRYPIWITHAINSLVGVIFFGINTTILNNKIKGIVHETSIASQVICLIAIHQLLF